MLGNWKIQKQLTKTLFEVICEQCGHTTQRRSSKLQTLHRCPSIIDGTKYCYKCQIRKELDFFHKDASVSGGYSKICKECYSERVGVIDYKYTPVNRRKSTARSTIYKKSNNVYTSTKTSGIEKFLSDRQKTLKYRHSNGKMKEYNLPDGYLYQQYISQNGKCYYTGITLDETVIGLSPKSISVDRLFPEQGYTVGNVVLCIHSINSMKLNMSVNKFKSYLSEVVGNLKNFSET